MKEPAVRQVASQDELDVVVGDGDIPEITIDGLFDISKATVVRIGGSSQPHVEARGSSQPHVVARESSQPRVVARESSQPHVVAWGSSQPRVVAWESSQPRVEAWGSSQPHVVAWGSSQPHVEAWGSSQPHVEARESSQPHVVARGSSQPRVVAWESSQPRVEAWGFAQVSADSSQGSTLTVDAGPKVAVAACGDGVRVNGGGFVVRRQKPSTGAEWCEWYGVPVRDDGTVVLFKALDDDWRGSHKTSVVYSPGTSPAAPDWDPEPECGGGLHFSPHPIMALRFCSTATHYVGCPVRLDEIVVHPEGEYPEKVKAPRVAAPVFEVSIDGDPIAKSPRVSRSARKAKVRL